MLPTGMLAGSITTDTRRTRRLLEGVAFVAIWIGLGYLLPVDANGYLLLGIPLTVGFQLLVRRRPLRELWVRNGTKFVLDLKGKAIAAVLLLTPAFLGVQALAAGSWVEAGWMAAAMAGALAAAYALRRTSFVQTLRAAAPATGIGIGILLMVVLLGTALVWSGQPLRPMEMLTAALLSAVLYFPVSFVLEEVAFRGALEPHAHHAGESRGWLSALFVSALWGLWHLPIAEPGVPVVVTIAQLLAVHCLIGVPLSFAWRRTGNLAAPALAHTLIDAVRHGLQAGL